MIEIVKKFLEEYNLTEQKNTFLVGFSGGCDSLSLLDILNKLSKKYGFKVVALHLNHNWRGKESEQDEINCRKFCEKNSIEYVSEILVKGALKSENTAREARYAFFLNYAKQYENCSVFTAHTRTDNAETVLYRIIKGTGIRGLQGILPKSERGHVPLYRPLLNLSRDEIEGYCIANGLIANVDSSNFDISYKRNFIRHKIMPLVKEINYNAEKSVVSLAKLAISQNNIIDEYMTIIYSDLFDDEKILTDKFMNLSSDVQQKLVYDLFLGEKLDYDYKKVMNILDFIKNNFNSKSGSRYSLTSDLWLFASSKYIYLIDEIKSTKCFPEITISKEGDYTIDESGFVFSIQKYQNSNLPNFPSEKEKTAYVNLESLDGLVIRTRKNGDYISPFGMTGKMKLKKYLTSKAIAQHKKDELILLCRGAEVLWVVGVGLSNKLKVVNMPSHVIQLMNT